MLKRWWAGPATAVAVAALFASACSSSSSGSNSSSGAASGSSEGTIKVLALGQFQASSFSFPEMEAAVKAVVQSTNDSGGINGKKIDLITCNDQGDPNVAATCARTAISDQVSAVIGTISEYGTNILPLLQAANIPYVNGLPLTTADYTNPLSFPIDGGNPMTFGAAGMALVKSGCKQAGVLSDGSSASAQVSGQQLAAGIKAAGGTVTKTVSVQDSVPDYSAPVSALLQAGAECVGLAETPTEMAKAIGAVRQSAKANALMAGSLTTLPQPVVASLKGGANGVLVTQGAYLPGAKTPTFLAQMKKYAPASPVDGASELAWSAATVFVDVAKQVSGSVTASSLLAQLKKTSNLTLQTYPDPINFTKPNPVAAYSRVFNTTELVYKVSGSSYVLAFPQPLNVETAITGG